MTSDPRPTAVAAEPSRSGPVIVADGLEKSFELGEHRSLARTLRYLAAPRRAARRNELNAVTDVSFEVYGAECLGIVGSNGSGKSTVLKIMGGITLPTRGRVTVKGRILPLLAVGAGFHPELTGRENVVLFGTILGLGRDQIDERIDAIAAFAETERHMDTPAKRYSSGLLARLSCAIAMLFPAEAYLFDEVLAVVDAEFQERCIRAIKELAATGSAVVFISHNLDQVRDVCDRVMWLENGCVEMIGDAEEVLGAYDRAHPGL